MLKLNRKTYYDNVKNRINQADKYALVKEKIQEIYYGYEGQETYGYRPMWGALRDEGFEVRGKKITIVGCGGAGKAIQIQAALDGARELAIFNRSVARGQEMADLINRHTSTKATFYPLGDEALLKEQLATSDLLINATNIGMGELKDQSFIRDSSLLPRDLFVCDIIYNPAKTKLLQQAEERGCRIMNGVGMIIYQGAEAFKKWTHHEMPIEEIKNVLNLKG